MERTEKMGRQLKTVETKRTEEDSGRRAPPSFSDRFASAFVVSPAPDRIDQGRAIGAGVERGSVVPSPSSPKAFCPQQ
jgi:hypothetical protein